MKSDDTVLQMRTADPSVYTTIAAIEELPELHAQFSAEFIPTSEGLARLKETLTDLVEIDINGKRFTARMVPHIEVNKEVTVDLEDIQPL